MVNSRSDQTHVSDSIAPVPTPENEYSSRLGKWERQVAETQKLHRRFWTYFAIILSVSLVVVIAGSLSLRRSRTSWLLLPAICAGYVLKSLAENSRANRRARRIMNFYQAGIARLRNSWQGCGIGGAEFEPDRHLYSADLDLFGAGSVFEFLCTARTAIGRSKMADWLLNPAEFDEVQRRHRAIHELRGMLDLREDWASLGGSVLANVNSSALQEWSVCSAGAFPKYARALAVSLPAALIVTVILGCLALLGHWWHWGAAILVALELAFAFAMAKRTRLASANVVLPSFELALLAPLLARLETEEFSSPLLNALQSRLVISGSRPSKRIRMLATLAWLLDLRRFEYFAVMASPLLWGTNLAILIDSWRRRNQTEMKAWLDSLGQFEALLCLARYSYENPAHIFPTLEPESRALLEAEHMGHPLLDANTCVPCDLTLASNSTQFMMVSGSNMSGKSTLLRAVGVNCVLALAGAPVRATRFRISPMRIGCSIAVHDSFLEGKSRFQAEVQRLKSIVAIARTGNLIFLLDELLGGTNSSDRLFGAQAIIEQLAAAGAVGLVTTHDLSLTKAVNTFGGRAANVHFEDFYENGEMRFDYKMRSGVLPRTNGRAVLAALGLTPA